MAFRCRGLTLLEVMVSITILTIAAVAIITTLTRVMLAQSSSSHHTVARLIAESELQKAVLAGPPAPPAPPLPIRNLAMVGQSTTPTMFSALVHWQVLPTQNEAGDPMFLETGQAMGSLWEVKAEIWWNSEDEAKGAVERGTQSLTVSKMVYIER